METELIRLARVCKLAPAAVRAAVVSTSSPVAARFLSADDMHSQFGIPVVGPDNGAASAIWLPLPAGVADSPSERRDQVGAAFLLLRYIAEDLPVVILTLTAGGATLGVAIIMWDTDARDWLHSSMSKGSFSLVVEPMDGGEPRVVNVQCKLGGEAVRDLFAFEFSVAGEDRGHALRAAALTAMTIVGHRAAGEPSGAKHRIVGVVAGRPADFGELARLADVVE